MLQDWNRLMASPDRSNRSSHQIAEGLKPAHLLRFPLRKSLCIFVFSPDDVPRLDAW